MVSLKKGDWLSRSSGSSQFSGHRNTSRFACQTRYRFIHSHCSGEICDGSTSGSRLCKRTFDEQLDGGKREPYSRRLAARRHLDVHEEVFEEAVGCVDAPGGGSFFEVVKSEGDKGVSLTRTHLVVDRLDEGQPVGIRVLGAKRGSQGARFALVGLFVVDLMRAAAEILQVVTIAYAS